MKQLFCLFVAALMLLALFTGCGNPETTIVGTEPEETLAKGTEWTAVPQPAYEVPDRFTGAWKGLEDTFTVKADAEIILPEDMGKLCTAKVKRHAFTQEEADKVLEVFLKGNTLYQEVNLTKEQCQGIIEKYEAILRGEAEYTGDGTIDRVPGLIEMYKKEMEKAPYAGEKPLADTKFHHPEPPMGAVGGDYSNYVIEGYADVDGRTLHVRMNNQGDRPYWADEVQVWEEGYGRSGGAALITYESIDARNDFHAVPIAGYEQQIAVGDRLMKDLGLDEFTCGGVIPAQYAQEVVIDDHYEPVATGEEGVLLEYVRQVNGPPLTKTNYDGTASESGAPDIGNWFYERIMVYVLGDRVVCFDWWNPYEITDIQSAGTLIDFRDIQDIFAQMIFVKNSDWLGINKSNGFDSLHDLNIDKAQLTLMRVRPRDSVTEGRIVPVWDFWGTERSSAPDYDDHIREEYGVLLTINALDGTVIDREIGY